MKDLEQFIRESPYEGVAGLGRGAFATLDLSRLSPSYDSLFSDSLRTAEVANNITTGLGNRSPVIPQTSSSSNAARAAGYP